MTSRRLSRLALMLVLGAGLGTVLTGCPGSAAKKKVAIRRALPKVERSAKRAFDRGVRELRVARGEREQARARVRARKQFMEAVEIDPRLWEAWHDIGLIDIADGDLPGAATALGKAIAIQPASVPTALTLADVLARLGRYDAARAELERALAAIEAARPKAKPEDAAAEADKDKDAAPDPDADPAEVEKARKEAEAEAAREAELQKRAAGGYTEGAVRLRLAALLRDQGKSDAALAEVRKVLRMEPASGAAYVELGLIYYKSGKLDLAALVMRKASVIVPKDPVVWNTLGLVALAQGKDQEAFSHFDAAAALDPQFATARFNKGAVYLDAGDYSRAAPELEAATAADPRDASILVALGVAYRGKKKYDEARGAYEKALEVDPRNADALWNLGVLYMDFQDSPAKARAPLERFLKVAPGNHPKRADAKSRLSEIAPEPAPPTPGAPAPKAGSGPGVKTPKKKEK